MQATNAVAVQKTVGDANAEYDSLLPLWRRSRAVCSGERYVKALDAHLDMNLFTNLLIPFSPSMTDDQYLFYKAEAELPGIVAQFSKMLIGGLLRKAPVLELSKKVPAEAKQWIIDEFAQDDSSLIAFLDAALTEEMPTSRAWIFVDYPRILPEQQDAQTPSQKRKLKPFPVIYPAETVINWRKGLNSGGKIALTRVITKGYEEEENPENEFHPDFFETVRVHEIFEGFYRIRIYRTAKATNVPVVNGAQVNNTNKGPVFELIETIDDIKMNGERLTFIPAWPLNGNLDAAEPSLTPLIDKEISLYNKISRRNHLLYGAATYTPVISSDMDDETFKGVVNAGLGSWLHLRQGDTATVLDTPTEALTDMDRAIAAGIEEMAKLGIRMLTPETSQSGVALDIRNASQNAQMGVLNTRISATMRQVIVCMLNWRYALDLTIQDVKFELSADFNPTPLGADWLRLATEWYEKGLIPRSIWLIMLKQNDMIPPEYDDEKGKTEILADMEHTTAVYNSDPANAATAAALSKNGP